MSRLRFRTLVQHITLDRQLPITIAADDVGGCGCSCTCSSTDGTCTCTCTCTCSATAQREMPVERLSDADLSALSAALREAAAAIERQR